MTALKLLLMIACILFVIGMLPIGVRVRYDEQGAMVQVLLGPVHLQIFPKKQTKKRKLRPKKNAEPKAKVQTIKKPKLQGLADLRPFLQLLFALLGEVKRKLVLRELTLHLTVGGEDPAQTAIRYGQAWAIIGSVLPLLEHHFTVQNRDVQVLHDFQTPEITVLLCFALRFRIGQGLALATRYGVRGLKELVNFKRKKEKTT